MNATNRTLDRLADRYTARSNYALAKLLDVSQATVGNYRHEKTGMSDDIAIKAAELLQEDACALVAALQEERAETDAARKVWRQIAGRLRRTAAVVTIGIAGILGFSHSPTSQAASSESTRINIMVNRRRVAWA